jgi:glycosyltransferase involved in cell wall biosynthesis
MRETLIQKLLNMICASDLDCDLEILIISVGKKFIYSSSCKHKIKTLFLPYDKGLGWARNLGAKLSESKYILFLDDDIILPHTKSLKILCKNAEENVIVGGNLKPLYEIKPPKWFDGKKSYLVGIGNIYYGIPYGACMLIGKNYLIKLDTSDQS